MFRQIRRHWHRRLTARARATLLLVTWAASIVLTVLHDDDGVAAAEPSESPTASVPECGAARVHHVVAAPVAKGPTIAARCGANGPCHDPTHHHAPLAHHDVTQCPFCAMLLERPAELPVFSFAPPTTIRLVVVAHELRLSSSQRCACALARGPPSVRESV